MELLVSEFSQAQTILIIVSTTAKPDSVAAATALSLALNQAGKDATLMTPDVENLHMEAMTQHIQGFESISTELGNRNLQISFPYTPEKVDKVNYHIDEDNQRFFLTIEPQAGVKPLSTELIDFSLVGADADLIFLFGVQDFELLDQLYFGYERLYDEATTVSINSFSSSVGDVKLDYGAKSSVSEGVVELLEQLHIPLTSDAATNLLLGISVATNQFSSLTTSADTFERVAQLLRAGARRIKLKDVDRIDSAEKGQSLAAALSKEKKHQDDKKTSSSVTMSGSGQVQIAKKSTKGSKKKSNQVGGLDHQPSQGGGFK